MKVSVLIEVFYQLKNNDNFKVSKCRKVINCKNQKIIKQIRKGGSIGYNIDGVFYNIKTLNKSLVRIPKETNIF